ncbi:MULTISPECIES: hypothetical protein [Acinetobacter]|uniref:DUF4468 domain-containing protein n=1 Tax=Acinetobacter pittii TaxID=48296 RepID=A0AB33BBS3_ACIPI|nr:MULTISPECIES: hypothetical protein [Acinetobacter]AMX20848.1 hypothetical protein IEC338SC_3763 [Acinetobacter pittii]EXE57368.1 hypothetical protein J580_3692 [Acinetobacter sp. 1542444]EXS25855.1 hypothetical protein J690_3489 [Acinetobacter sp. 742879]KIE84181.1 hypothetical protein SD67_17355 [Acinetobacter pittii]MBJ6354296.1 hypothetical protein [Acinetobacter sp. c1]
MKKFLGALTLTLCTTTGYAALVNLNIDEFQKTIKTLNKEKGYNGEIKSGALTGKVQEKFIVTGTSATDEREPVLMTGYYLGATEVGNLYSITEYRIYCDDQTYGFAMSNFEPDGALSLTTTDSNYAFDYEDPTPRDQQFSKILKKACKYSAK